MPWQDRIGTRMPSESGRGRKQVVRPSMHVLPGSGPSPGRPRQNLSGVSTRCGIHVFRSWEEHHHASRRKRRTRAAPGAAGPHRRPVGQPDRRCPTVRCRRSHALESWPRWSSHALGDGGGGASRTGSRARRALRAARHAPGLPVANGPVRPGLHLARRLPRRVHRPRHHLGPAARPADRVAAGSVRARGPRGAVPLREAVEAPGNVEPEPQLAWILGLGRAAASEEPSSPEVAIGGDDASAVLEARRRARILVGRRVNNQEVDAFIVSVYERKVPLDELRSQARVRPAAPPEPGALAWDWCADEAPAQRALGPWTEPADPTEAIAQVEALKRQRGGAAKLVPAWIDADHGAVWAELGYASRCAFARAVCGWSRRTAQRRARVGWALEWYPAPDAAVRSGMGLGTAEALVPVLDERNVHRWLAVASRTSRRDRMDLVSAAHVEARVGATLARTESAIAAADAWQAKGGSPSTAPSAGDVSSDGPPAAAPPAGDAPDGPPNAAPSAGDAPDGSPPAAPSAGDAPDGSPAAAPSAGDAPLGVSLARPDAPTAPDERAARSVRATEELVEAARWWLAHVVLPPQRGVTKVKERDGYTCQNPECRRRTLRFEAHHEPPAPRAAATTRPTCSASVDRATCGACTPGPQSTPRASPPPRRPSAPPRHPPDLRGTKADSAAAGRARPSRPRWPVTPTSS